VNFDHVVADAAADPLAAQLAELGRFLPPVHRRAWAQVLQTLEAPGSTTVARLLAAHPGAGLAARADALVSLWRQNAPELTGAALALALETAASQFDYLRAEQRIDLVASGPISRAVPVRSTSSVAVEVIRHARANLLVVSFAAYGVKEIVQELKLAAGRGVSLDLVLETSTSAANAFEDLGPSARLWHWPEDNRSHTGGGRSALHAKLIAADRDTLLMGSANLTDRALADNLEIGLVLHNPELVGRVVDHFAALMDPANGPLRLRGPSK
jgi:putative cardiolipin synthase